jgi:outer membrane protein TolC
MVFMFSTTKGLRTFFHAAVTVLIMYETAMGQSQTKAHRITLTEAQAQAVSKSGSRLAQLGIDAAKYHRRAAQADYFPKIGSTFANFHFNKFLGQIIQTANRTVELPLAAKDQTIVAFTVTQPVTPLFKVHQVVEIAKTDEAIAQAKAAQLNGQLAGDVEQAYFELLIAQRRQTVAETKVTIVESPVQVVTTAPSSLNGVTDSHTALLEAMKELATANSKVSELTHSLNALIGFPPDTELELVAPDLAADTLSLSEASQQALANNVEIVEAEQAVVKARAAAKLSKLEYVPDVAVIGGYAYQTAVPLLPRDLSFIGVMATYNLFDFGKRESIVSERKSQLSMAEANLDLVKAKVAASVQKTFLDLERLKQIRNLTRQLAIMHQSSPEARTVLAKAEADMYQAELDYRVDFAQLKRSIDGP